MAQQARQAAVRGGALIVAGVGGAGVANNRAAEPASDGLIISDGSASWELVAVSDEDVRHVSKQLASAVGGGEDSAGRTVMEMGRRLAQRPEMQRALAEELGCKTAVALAQGALSTEELQALVEDLTRQKEENEAQVATLRAKLDERDAQLRAEEAALKQEQQLRRQLETQNNILLDPSSHGPETFQGNHRNTSDATFQDPAAEEVQFFENLAKEDGSPSSLLDSALLVDDGIDDEDVVVVATTPGARAEALYNQVLADEELARCLQRDEASAAEDQVRADFAYATSVQAHEDANIAWKSKNCDKAAEDSDHAANANGDPTLTEELLAAAAAVASLIILVVAARKYSPAMAKNAFVLSAAAAASIVHGFRKGKN